MIIVQFVVNKEGRVSDITALTREGYGMEQEVVRIMRKSGMWTPAIQNSRPVNAYRKQPVTFMTSQDGFNILTKTPYVLYADANNELTIDVDKVKPEDLEATISEGTIIYNEDGKFIARVSKPGRVLVTVFNKKKKNKEIGAMSFEVRAVNLPPAGTKS
ncbi:energy transducer TonB [Terrimonas alba]|uniref:energy transducer TonB n=1 Tax=Terrimonas alba TaxID=3349636 RepID=UPI0035F2E36A